MANFNSVPTEGNSANNCGYTPESFSDTNDTAQLPKLDKHTNGFNSDDTPDAQPAADPEQNAAEGNNTERKSHLGRNLVIGGVAVALAFSAWAFSQNGDTAKPAPDAVDTPVATEGYTDNDIVDEPEESIDDNIGIRSDNPEDGLLASQVINDYMTVNNGVDTMMASEYIRDWMSDNGYASPIAEPLEGDYLLRGSGGFMFRYNDGTEHGATMVFGLTSTGNVDVIMQETSVDKENNKYSYSSDSIPTADEAREIAAQNLQ